VIDAVEGRVLLDREEKNGEPVKITRDYYAIDKTTGDVYLLRRASRNIEARKA
jgi:hypothetical protein